MKSSKRFMVRNAILILLIAVFIAGCGGGNGATPSGSTQGGSGSGGGSADQGNSEITFSWLVEDMVEAPVRDDWKIFEEIKEKTGVSLNFEVVSFGGFNERKQIMIATNSVSDFLHVSSQEAREHGEDGVFLNLKEYFDVAPNVKQFFADNPEAEAIATGSDGGIYGVPVLESNVESNGFNYTWNARHDLMEKYGLEAPTNTDEFYEFLKALKAEDPNSYPLILRTPITNQTGLVTLFTRAFTGLEGLIQLDPKDEQFKFAGYHENFIDALKYMNKLYSEGLLDPEFALLTAAQWQERLMSGNSSVTYFWKSDIGPLVANAKASGADDDFNLHAIPMFAAKDEYNYQFSRPAVGNNVLVISSNVADKDRAVEFLDYLLSDEGLEYLALGIEGETYTIEDGKPVYNQEFGDAPYTTLRRDYGVWFQKISINNAISRDAWENAPDEKMQQIQEMYGPFIVPHPKGFVKTSEEIELEKSKLENVNQFLEQEITKFITGSVPINEETYDHFISQAQRLGVDDLVNMNNEAYQRAYGSN